MSGVSISFLKAGYCTHPERIVNVAAPWASKVFPASVAVIEHPLHGITLYDTGYSEFFFRATQAFPQRLYRWITPVFLEEGKTAKQQLHRHGIKDQDVRHIVLSHFHGDHIGAVRDFNEAKFIYSRESYLEISDLRGFSALRKGFLPTLLPDDFLERSECIEFLPTPSLPSELSYFTGARDLFGDGSIWLVELPGHTEGHTGLFVRTDQKDFFLVGDACYVRENYILNSPSSAVTRLIQSDFKKYKATLAQLNKFHIENPSVLVVPCHCETTMNSLGQ